MADLRFMTISASNDWMGSADWPVGKVEVGLHLWSSAYVGLDVSVKVQFELDDAEKLPKFRAHPDDVAIAKQPATLFEMLQPQAEEAVDSDFDDGAEEDGEEEGEEEGEAGEEAEEVTMPDHVGEEE